MTVRSFTYLSTEHEGRRLRSVSIVCSRCPTKFSVPMSTIQNAKPRDQDTQLARIATRKFDAAGWFVGHNAAHDLCPSCRPKLAAEPAKPKPVTPTEKPTMQAPATVVASHPPRQMGIDDALTIASKLQEVYLGKDKGYADNWTDAKIAESLGTPRAWVKEVRVKSYGDGLAGNDEIALALCDTQTVRDEARGVLKQIEAAAATVRDRLDRIDTRLAALAKSMQ